MMREDSLLCVRGRAFVVTTDSNHHLPVYPNLERDVKPMVINQLSIPILCTSACVRSSCIWRWCLDAFSRRVIGWALGRTLEAS